MTDNMGSMGDVAKYGGTAQITDEDMRRRNEDNAKVVEACADQAQEWATTAGTFTWTVGTGKSAAPTAGTFTCTVGTGKSDPIPYNADAAQVNAAFRQAAERNTEAVEAKRKTSLLPLPWTPHADHGTTIYGRMDGEYNPATCPQAKLRHNTTCDSCGQGFKAGAEIVATLASPPAEGEFRHRQCHPNSQSYAEPHGDNAKVRAACADQAEDWAARDIAIPQGLLTHCPCPDPLAKIERDMRDESTEAVVAWARGLLGLVDESAVREAMGLPNG